MIIDPTLLFKIVMVWLLLQVPIGMVVGWWLRKMSNDQTIR